MAYRLDTDTVSLSFGGLEYAVFLPDRPVKSVFDPEQQDPLCVQIRCHFDLPPGVCRAQAGFQSVFQKIGKHKAHIDLIDRRLSRQIDLRTERNILPFCQGAVIADHAVCRAVFAEAHIELRDPGSGFGKIILQRFDIADLGKRGDLVQMMTHIVPCLPHFLNGGFQILIALLLHG